MSGQARTWPSLDALRLAFGEVTRVAETEDRRYAKVGRLVFESLAHGEGRWSPWLRRGRQWPASEIRQAKEQATC